MLRHNMRSTAKKNSRLFSFMFGLSALSPIAVTVALPLALTSFVPSAEASCAASPMTGQWVNVYAETRGITRLTYTQGCPGPRLCPNDGGPCTQSNPPSTISISAACHPTDCEWGRANVMADRGGQYAVYDHRAARRVLRLRLNRDGQLVVTASANYRDGRTDRTREYTLRKQ